ncbi:MAG: hypothetical protein IKK44_02155 [Clostridium sp.]|nr:hypothetical protein [Clostridium sp.]
MPKHILISGARGVGKSTLIRRLLEHSSRTVCGFYTKSLPMDESGTHPVYIHPAATPEGNRIYTPENRIAICTSAGPQVNCAAFDVLGVDYLTSLPENGLVLMDELGFMESRSECFTRKVLEILDGDLPVIAAIKNRMDIPFLAQLHRHPNAAVYEISTDNREELFQQLLPLVEAL